MPGHAAITTALLVAASAAAGSGPAPPTTASRFCGPGDGGAWTGATKPYTWSPSHGCVYPINTLLDFQLAFAGRSLVIMGDSVSRDVALSAPMRYAGCDALERAGLEAEAALAGNSPLAAAWCAARRTFHHQNVYQNYTFAFPAPGRGVPTALGAGGGGAGGGGGRAAGERANAAGGAVLEYHWSRFMRDAWATPAWRRFVEDGDFTPGRDALVLNAFFWNAALAHEARFGLRTLTQRTLFSNWRKELDETVARAAASPHVERLRRALFWRTCTWREWPGAGGSYKPAFDNYHIMHANRYARVAWRKAGFRVLELEKYSHHATRAPEFRGAGASLVVTKDSVHFPGWANLAMFRELASSVHLLAHAEWTPAQGAPALGWAWAAAAGTLDAAVTATVASAADGDGEDAADSVAAGGHVAAAGEADGAGGGDGGGSSAIAEDDDAAAVGGGAEGEGASLPPPSPSTPPPPAAEVAPAAAAAAVPAPAAAPAPAIPAEQELGAPPRGEQALGAAATAGPSLALGAALCDDLPSLPAGAQAYAWLSGGIAAGALATWLLLADAPGMTGGGRCGRQRRPSEGGEERDALAQEPRTFTMVGGRVGAVRPPQAAARQVHAAGDGVGAGGASVADRFTAVAPVVEWRRGGGGGGQRYA